MRRYRIFIDTFSSGLDELSAKDQRDESAVLRALDGMERVSVFEVTAYRSLANTFQYLEDAALIKTDCVAYEYPWVGVRLTDAGREWMRTGRKREGRRARGHGGIAA